MENTDCRQCPRSRERCKKLTLEFRKQIKRLEELENESSKEPDVVTDYLKVVLNETRNAELVEEEAGLLNKDDLNLTPKITSRFEEIDLSEALEINFCKNQIETIINQAPSSILKVRNIDDLTVDCENCSRSKANLKALESELEELNSKLKQLKREYIVRTENEVEEIFMLLNC